MAPLVEGWGSGLLYCLPDSPCHSTAHKALCWQMRPVIKVYINPQPLIKCPMLHMRLEIFLLFCLKLLFESQRTQMSVKAKFWFLISPWAVILYPLLSSNWPRRSFLAPGNIWAPWCLLVGKIRSNSVPSSELMLASNKHEQIQKGRHKHHVTLYLWIYLIAVRDC